MKQSEVERMCWHCNKPLTDKDMGTSYCNECVKFVHPEDRIRKLKDKLADIEYKHGGDWEAVHSEQDDALLEFIGDDEVTEIFRRTTKWCA